MDTFQPGVGFTDFWQVGQPAAEEEGLESQVTADMNYLSGEGKVNIKVVMSRTAWQF